MATSRMRYMITADRETKVDRETKTDNMMKVTFIIEEDGIPTNQRIQDALRMCVQAGVVNKEIVLSNDENGNKMFNTIEDLELV